MELSKTFDPKSAEDHWFQLWIDRGYFKADANRPGPVFSIVIPPPNVTGALHLGHALNSTIHDVIVRTRRMQGFNTLWLPGTDHAGIATQNVVEREIAKGGKTRHEMGREQFVDRVWQWRETYGGKILNQLRRLGASCDWSRERFTLDEGLSRAVTKVFVMLYNEGLIERDYRLINWCPRCETALSDLEVDHKDVSGNLWYIKYPLSDGSGSITVATTRPETMLGDTAVAVHPDDERYRAMAGKTVRLPLIGRDIPIVTDASVDKEFGTGAVKITPGHDFNDFELGRRHSLPQISVMDTHGRMSAEAGPYAGLTREDCRRKVVADLEAAGLIEKIEPHRHAVGTCSRCDTIVEPMLSYQWFLRVNKPGPDGKSLGGEAIAAVEQGATIFHPKFWENTYFSWMRNLQDWCISRQLWWGHRIPAYWCDRCEDSSPIVAEERPHSCPACGGGDLRQDEDVLDTWFSSGLWPFSTLGWPDRTLDLEKYYPTSLLITGFDIIFFWVARMMMFGIKFAKGESGDLKDRVPFRDVFITPLVRDQFGKKMTKSRGNVVDPLEIMDRFGTDAVRFTLAQLTVQGRDLVLSEDRLSASRAFANKIWNAARFVLMNLEGAPQPIPPVETSKLSLADRWILSRLDHAIDGVTKAIDTYEFNTAALTVYQFIWHEFCDWYIELSKEPLKAGGAGQAATRYVMVHCFDRMLRILHPFMPFISEEIWQAIRPYLSDANLSDHLAVAKFPTPADRDPLSETEAAAMARCIEATQAVNSLRSLLGFHPGMRSEAQLKPVFLPPGTIQASASSTNNDFKNDTTKWEQYFLLMSKSSKLNVLDLRDRPADGAITTPLPWCEVSIVPPSGFNLEGARSAIEKKLLEVETHLNRIEKRLGDPNFSLKADRDTIADTQDQLNDLLLRQGVFKNQLMLLPGDN